MSAPRFDTFARQDPFAIVRRRRGRRVDYAVVSYGAGKIYPGMIDEDQVGRHGLKYSGDPGQISPTLEQLLPEGAWIPLRRAREIFGELVSQAREFDEAMGVGA